MKKNSIILKLVRFNEPRIKGLKVEAKVPKILNAPFPIATTLKGKSSTAYNKNMANSTAMHNLKTKIRMSSMMLSAQRSHPLGFSIIATVNEVIIVIRNKIKPAFFRGTFSMK